MFVLDCDMSRLIYLLCVPLYLLYQIINHAIHSTKPDLQFASQYMAIFFEGKDVM